MLAPPQRRRPEPLLVLFAEARYPPPRRTTKSLWSEQLVGLGGAAIAVDGLVVAAMRDGRAMVFAPDGQPTSSKGVRVAEAQLEFAPSDVAIVGTLAVLIGGDGGGHDVAAIDLAARSVWRARTSISPLQPPVDGADGRVYVAGSGIAAIDGGTILGAWRR